MDWTLEVDVDVEVDAKSIPAISRRLSCDRRSRIFLERRGLSGFSSLVGKGGSTSSHDDKK